MVKLWKPALFFLLALTLALTINMPVALVLDLVKMPDNIRVFQPRGSLLSGRFGGVEINQYWIRNLEYEAKLSCLLSLGLCYQASNSYGSLQVRHQPFSLDTELTQVNIEFPLEDLDRVLGGLLIQPTGKIKLNLDKVLINKDKLAELKGILVWVDAGIAGEDINLGDYQVSVEKNKDKYELIIADKDAVLDIAGKGSLKADGKYTLDITIRTRSGLEPGVKNALELVARKQGINQYIVRSTGNLEPALLSQLNFSEP